MEAESNRVGNVFLPKRLWAKMRAGEVVELSLPVESRVRHLMEEYAPLRSDPESLKEKLRRFASRHGQRRVEGWCRHVDACEWESLVRSLLEIHYDPAYATSARKNFPRVSRVVSLPDCVPDSLDELARQLRRPLPAAAGREVGVGQE